MDNLMDAESQSTEDEITPTEQIPNVTNPNSVLLTFSWIFFGKGQILGALITIKVFIIDAGILRNYQNIPGLDYIIFGACLAEGAPLGRSLRRIFELFQYSGGVLAPRKRLEQVENASFTMVKQAFST